ncbi:MAG: DGQHR domain protein [Candidatus Accumulibacter adjunctus]|uniref:DGQHR domain protein n=1 Tax=Candidatus Accumulibacter adjunctus TaxID=1454001 RepID=A0A011NLN3_9PROT|nr:MAG: DGQHR domain protein [Candidatus Accumulibacter adjunctus]
MSTYEYQAILPRQSDRYTLFAFCARAADVLRFSQIDRIGRREDGSLRGFQRPQVAAHIREIRAYLERDDAVLPNSVVVAFTRGVNLSREGATALIRIDASEGPVGFVVDGQQRLSALAELPEKDFEVFVSGILCESEDELRKQFILINNTRPLPKPLIYELLPTVEGLPHRLSSRSDAAALVERLNYDEASSLRGQIKQHTNPTGVLQDTVIQKLVMASLSDGALRELSATEDGQEGSFQLISNFFGTVQDVFQNAWIGHTPRTSRLVHGVGVMAMGYVMEYLHAARAAFATEDFRPALESLRGVTAWTSGTWNFGEGNQRPWNGLQFIPRDYMELSQYLLAHLKHQRAKRLS